MLALKTIRKAKGYSLAELSAAANVPQRTIEECERRKDCRISTAYKLARALDISLDDLWVEDPEE